MTKTGKAMAAAFVGNFVFGLSFLFTKTALAVTTPAVLLFWRFLLAFAVLLLLRALRLVHIDLHGKPIGKLILMGLFQPVLYFFCENYGLLYTNATFSAVMIALVPIASLAFGALFMRELPTPLQVVCSAVSVFGVMLMAMRQSANGAITAIGVLLLCGAVMSAVGFNVISRGRAKTVSPVERTYMMFAVGTVAFGAAAAAENFKTPLSLFAPLTDGGFLIALLYLGVLSSVGAFLMIHYANTYLSLSRATVFSNVITVVSVFAGVVLLREPFDGIMLAAALLIIGGIAGVQRFSKDKEQGE